MNQGIKFYGVDEVYSESGIDLTLLRSNLKLTVEQRLAKNQAGVRLALALREAGSKAFSQCVSFPKGDRMPELQVSELLHKLVESKVEFVLIGGLAMRAHGSAHTTDDMDVCYSRTDINIKAVSQAMAPLHPYMRGAPQGLPFKFDEATIKAGLNFTLATARGEIDFLGEVAGLGGYDKVFAQSREMSIFGFSLWVLTLDGLIAAKKAAGRRKDQLHVLELEELKKMRDAAN
jgi:predicted nucleotidyltransferase